MRKYRRHDVAGCDPDTVLVPLEDVETERSTVAACLHWLAQMDPDDPEACDREEALIRQARKLLVEWGMDDGLYRDDSRAALGKTDDG